MNYLMAYTTGKAGEAIQNYEGLPNGCQLALGVLHQRFGQNSMIIESLKSSIINGPKLKASDSASLLAFSDRLQNCYWSMVELKSTELDCTTNLMLIYDRLSDPLQRKWRNEAKLHRLKTGGREPTLKELCAFISAEAQTENDPVYANSAKVMSQPTNQPPNRRNRRMSSNRPLGSANLPTLATHLQTSNKPTSQDKASNEARPSQNVQPSKGCKICKNGHHAASDCATFASKNVGWRRRYARVNKLCYKCLSTSHRQKDCSSTEKCNVQNCPSPSTHHRLLHLELKDDVRDFKESTSTSGQEGTTSINQHSTLLSRSLVMLKVVPLRVIGQDGRTVTTYALLDSASVSTMITSQLAQKLQLKGQTEEISINTVVNSNHSCNLKSVGFDLTPVAQEEPRFNVRQALVVETLNIPEQYCPTKVNLSCWSHLQELELDCTGVDLEEVSVLVGQDVPQAHVVEQYCWGDNPSEQPYGMKTPFAWCVAGPTNTKDIGSKPIALSILNPHGEVANSPDSILHQQVEKFWSLENYGFKNSNEVSPSIEDMRAMDLLKKTTKHKTQGYEVGLLWRKPDVTLPNNMEQAERRLGHLLKRFNRDIEFAQKYKDVMDDYLKKGYAKKLSDDEAKQTSNITWYLPHHGVVNPNKPKLRVVFDAAAENNRVSLNKELLQGPQLNNTLLGVLLRFRQEKVALTSDIESMFHRVSCNERDTDALRFLWWSDGFDKAPTEHKMMVHLFGKTDSPCMAAWALKKTAEDHGHEFRKEVSRVVDKNFYVDDCLVSVLEPSQAIELAHDLMVLLKKGNFRLTKFTSNSKEVLSAIPAEELTIKNLDLDDFTSERALGVQWNIQSDTLGIQQLVKEEEIVENTRRECLSILSSSFDPFGMIAPVMLPAKRVVQRTWQLKLHWDEVLPDDLLRDWKKWKEDLADLSNVTLPRCYFADGSANIRSLQLHHFSDASEIGYGTVTYLRKESTDGKVECAFVMAKSRTAPLQYVSVPRLELQAATIAIRVHCLLLKELDLNITDTYFWTDSKLVLQYIYNESRRFKTYVANRVSETRDASLPSMWRHCLGELNPADDTSRGMTADNILSKKRWLCGPDFLSKPEAQWPNEEPGDLPEDDAEIKKERPIFATAAPDSLQALLNRYSSWSTLLRKIAWLTKFKKFLKYRSAGKHFTDDDKQLTVADLELATRSVVQLVQRQMYAEEIQCLKKNKMVKTTSNLVRLQPVPIDDVVRVGGRIADAPISFGSKYPMILPPNHHVTQLLILHYHQKLAHAGQDHILAQIREQFWIPKGGSAVRKVVRSCLMCRRYNATRMEQVMASLPAFRTTAYEPCFTLEWTILVL